MRFFNFGKKSKKPWLTFKEIPLSIKIMGVLLLIFLISISASNLKVLRLTTRAVETGNIVVLKILQVTPNYEEPFLYTIFANYGTFEYNGVKYVMTADMVSIDDFNNGVKNDLSNYDGLVLGFSDSNSKKDLNPATKTIIENFINSGKPVIFGHDTDSCWVPNLSSLTQTYLGVLWVWPCPDPQWQTNSYLTTSWRNWFAQGENFDPIDLANDPVLNIPYHIDTTTNLSTIETHSLGSVYHDDLRSRHYELYPNDFHPEWFPNLKHYFCNPDPEDNRDDYRNCYLVLNGRFAQSQMGHTVGVPTDEEQKLYVNLLFTAYQNSNPPPPPPPSEGDVYNITNNYNFDYKGVSIHTKVVGPDGISATARSGDEVTFTLTINNPEEAAKNVDVKFTLPPGFTYVPGSASIPPDSQSGQDFFWNSYPAPLGDSIITLKATVP